MEFVLHGAQHREIGQEWLRAIVGKKAQGAVCRDLAKQLRANHENKPPRFNIQRHLINHENGTAENSTTTKELNLAAGKQVFLQPQRLT